MVASADATLAFASAMQHQQWQIEIFSFLSGLMIVVAMSCHERMKRKRQSKDGL